jgi:hypothetical protein
MGRLGPIELKQKTRHGSCKAGPMVGIVISPQNSYVFILQGLTLVWRQ